jgi:hypothetical protein
MVDGLEEYSVCGHITDCGGFTGEGKGVWIIGTGRMIFGCSCGFDESLS